MIQEALIDIAVRLELDEQTTMVADYLIKRIGLEYSISADSVTNALNMPRGKTVASLALLTDYNFLSKMQHPAIPKLTVFCINRDVLPKQVRHDLLPLKHETPQARFQVIEGSKPDPSASQQDIEDGDANLKEIGRLLEEDSRLAMRLALPRRKLEWRLNEAMTAAGVLSFVELHQKIEAWRPGLLSYQEVARLVNLSPDRISLEILESLMTVLGCQLSDILSEQDAGQLPA